MRKGAVTGIPVSLKFSSPVQPVRDSQADGAADDLSTLLVFERWNSAWGPVAQILGELNKLAKPLQVVVVCGRNEELRRELAVLERRHPTHVLGFVTNMHEWMAVSDLVITKPGGLDQLGSAGDGQADLCAESDPRSGSGQTAIFCSNTVRRPRRTG